MKGMIAISQIGVLDFNCGVGLCQAKTKFRKLRYKQQFSRITQSWVIQKAHLLIKIDMMTYSARLFTCNTQKSTLYQKFWMFLNILHPSKSLTKR